MSHFRIMSVLAPRVSQLINLAVEPSYITEPFLKKDDIYVYHVHIYDAWFRFQRTLWKSKAKYLG